MLLFIITNKEVFRVRIRIGTGHVRQLRHGINGGMLRDLKVKLLCLQKGVYFLLIQVRCFFLLTEKCMKSDYGGILVREVPP